MSDQLRHCPHCGQPLDLPAEPELGIIYASEDAEPPTRVNLITVQDLDGKNSQQRKALIYLRFNSDLKFKDGVGAFEDVDGYMFEDWEKHLPALMEGGSSTGPGQNQLELDLAAVEPFMDSIIQDGRFVYGYQSRIAEALRVPNEGSYRRRIKNVAAVLARRLGPARPARDSISTTAPVKPADHADQRAA
jgi:hypothetical protein